MILQKIREAIDELEDFFGQEQEGDGVIWARQCRNVASLKVLLAQMKPWPSWDLITGVFDLVMGSPEDKSMHKLYLYLIQHQAPQWTEDKEKLLAAYKKEAEAASRHIKGFEPRLDVDGLWADPFLENEYFKCRDERVKLEGM